MMHFFKQWDHWWCRSAPPHLLAILRIGFGLFLIIEALTYLPFTPQLFSKEGFVMSLQMPHLPDVLEHLLQPPSVSTAWIIAGIYMLALLALTTGFSMRSAIVVLLFLYWYYWQLSFHLFPSSYHRLFSLIFCVLLCSGADKTFSLHMLLKKGSMFAWEPISILPQRLISVQMTATYLGVGWQKLWLPTWQGGEILSYSMIGRWASPMARWIVQRNWPMWVWDMQNWIVKIFECLIAFGLWIPRVQWVFFLGGAIFHIVISLFLQIWWFLVLIPAYIVFLDPEEVYRFLKQHSGKRIP